MSAEPSPTRRRLGLIQVHAGVLLAGFASVFAKLIDATPLTITLARCSFGSMALLTAALWTGTSLRIYGSGDLLRLALSGGILAVHWTTFFLAIQRSTVAIGVITFAAFPVFVMFLEPMLFRERLRRSDLVSVILVAIGVGLVSPGFEQNREAMLGVSWGLISAFSFAVLTLMNRSLVVRYAPTTVSFMQQFVAAAILSCVSAPSDVFATSETLMMLVTLGVIGTALAHGLYAAGIRHIRATTAGVIFGLEPVYGIALAYMILAEVPTARTVAGGVTIGVAVVWTSLRRDATATG